MKTTTIRWAALTHAGIARAAERRGVSFTQFVREAALVVAAWDLGVDAAGELPSTPQEMEAVRAAAREVLARAMDED